MLSMPEITALQRRLAKERITHVMERSMQSHAIEQGMRPTEWEVEHHPSPGELLRATSTPSRKK
jgi:hypothetical protein